MPRRFKGPRWTRGIICSIGAAGERGCVMHIISANQNYPPLPGKRGLRSVIRFIQMEKRGIWVCIKSGERTLDTDRDAVPSLMFGYVKSLVCARHQGVHVRGV